MSALALTGAAPASGPVPDACATVPACMDRLVEIGPRREAYPVELKLVSFGGAAVGALVSMLRSGDSRVREVAALTLAQFPRIDPRYLPDLLAAWRGADGKAPLAMLPRALAATGTAEALEQLQASFLRNPDFSNNTQVLMALGKSGDRSRPFIEAQLEACRLPTAVAERCLGLISILGEIPGGIPQWAIEPVVSLARAERAPARVRQYGADFAVRQRHPYGLTLLERRLEPLMGGSPAQHRTAEGVLKQAARYGPAGSPLAPRIVTFLASPVPDTRAAAALALADIGTPAGIAELIALEPAFEDDWLLAYNSVEALGRMRATQPVPLLGRVARDHWHRAVRNNAARALNAVAGGAFARPDTPGDSEPLEPDSWPEEISFISGVRYRADVGAARWCGTPAGSRLLAQDPVGEIVWPASGAQTLVLEPLSESETAELRARYPELPGVRRYAFRHPLAGGRLLVGWDRGEFGGGVTHLGPDGDTATISDENARFSFRMNGRLYLVGGLSHLVISRGAVTVVDEVGPRVVRNIRLPSDPTGAVVTAAGAVVIRTPAGDVAIREDGKLLDPETLGACPGPPGGSPST